MNSSAAFQFALCLLNLGCVAINIKNDIALLTIFNLAVAAFCLYNGLVSMKV